MRQRFWLVVRGLLVLLLLLTACLAWMAWGPMPPVEPSQYNQHHNAVWLGHRWFAQPASANDVAELAKHLQQGQIVDVYLHVGPLDARGQIPAWNETQWAENAKALRAAVPGLRVYAWVGGITSVWTKPAADVINLGDAAVRAAIATTTADVVKRGHFDGAHYDLELLADGDQGWLELLDRTRAALGRDAALSVVGPLLRPRLMPARVFWTAPYWRTVAQHCDQIALMGYDTAMPTKRMYERFLGSQVAQCCKALEGTRCRLMVGVPTYGDRTRSHDPAVENLSVALRGVARGLQKTTVVAPFQGVAVYAAWTTDDTEWNTLATLWCGAPR
jgi:hypothetical protein